MVLDAPATQRAMQRATLVLGLAAGAFVVLIWSGWLVVSRFGVTGGLSIYDIALLRFGVAAIVVTPFALVRRDVLAQLADWRVVVVALGCGAPYVLLSFAGLRLSEASNAGIIVNGALPVIGTAMLLALGLARPSVLAAAGMALVVAANLALLGDGAVGLPAAALLVAAAFSLSVYMVGVKLWGLTTRTVVIATPLVNVPICLPLWLVMDGGFAGATAAEIVLQAVYQGLVVSVLATALLVVCIRRAGALAASLMMAFVPIVTPLLAGAAIGEGPSRMLVGLAAATTLGIALVTLGTARANTAAATSAGGASRHAASAVRRGPKDG